MTFRQSLALPAVLATGTLAFVLLALGRAEGTGAPFAAALLLLAGAAAAGPFAFTAPPGAPRWAPLRQGAAAGAAFALAGALACGAAAAARGAPLGPALAAGALPGLYAFALGALAHALGGGLARACAAALGLALLATLFHWDKWFLLEATDRKASAALAFALNPAAAVSVTLGFDWIHCAEVYRNNETAESLVSVPLAGAGTMAWKLAALGAIAGVAGLWRRP